MFANGIHVADSAPYKKGNTSVKSLFYSFLKEIFMKHSQIYTDSQWKRVRTLEKKELPPILNIKNFSEMISQNSYLERIIKIRSDLFLNSWSKHYKKITHIVNIPNFYIDKSVLWHIVQIDFIKHTI